MLEQIAAKDTNRKLLDSKLSTQELLNAAHKKGLTLFAVYVCPTSYLDEVHVDFLDSHTSYQECRIEKIFSCEKLAIEYADYIDHVQCNAEVI